jgi:hypothetical protein
VIFTIFGGEMDLPARWFCRLGGGIRYLILLILSIRYLSLLSTLTSRGGS